MNTTKIKNVLKAAYRRDFQVKGERFRNLWHFNVVLPCGELDPKRVKEIVLENGAVSCDVIFEHRKVA